MVCSPASMTARRSKPGHRAGGGLPSEPGGGGARPAGDKRLDGANPFGDTLFTERNWRIVDALRRVAEAMDETPARVALAWVLSRPGVDTALMGVSRVSQVHDNIAATDLVVPADHLAALDAATSPETPTLYGLFTPAVRRTVVFGGSSVAAR